MSKPIIEFKNNIELQSCLKYWKDKLYLNNWIIKAELVDDIGTGSDALGINKTVLVHKTALIKILKGKHKGEFIKPCAEKVLIHELLHCKFEVEVDRPTIEELKYMETQHQELEMLARSLLRVKYNLSASWFDNIGGSSE